MGYQRRYSPRELLNVVPDGQYGRLYVENTCPADSWASLSVWVLPPGYKRESTQLLTTSAVQVFGMNLETGVYCWLHTGPWIRDYEDLVQMYNQRRAAKDAEVREAALREGKRSREMAGYDASLAVIQQRRAETLASYPTRPWSTWV